MKSSGDIIAQSYSVYKGQNNKAENMKDVSKIKIALIELLPELPNLSSFHTFPFYGTVILGTKLHNFGFNTTVFLEGISKFTVHDLEKFHFVCFSTKSPAANKIYKMSDYLRTKGKTIIMGGTHATYFTEDCLLHCDYVVHGEGDDDLPRLITHVMNNQDPSVIPGLSYKQNGETTYTGRQISPDDLTTVADYSLIKDISKLGRFPELVRRKRVFMPVQSSRGCPNKCSFCIVPKMFGKHYRKRPISSVISEIRAALQYTQRIFFIDNNFVGSSEADICQTKNLLKAIKENFSNIRALVFVTSDIVKRPDLLALMYSAGIRGLIIGFESLDTDSLKSYSKNCTTSTIEQSVKILKKYGFAIIGSFIANGDYDTPSSIISTARMAAKWDIDFMYYFFWAPYPQMVHDQTIKKRLFLNNWDYLNGHYLYLLPQKGTPIELQKAFLKANRIFYSYKRIIRCLLNREFDSAKIAFFMSILFRRVEYMVYKRKYMSYLRQIESKMYQNGKLNEAILNKTKIERLKAFDFIDEENLPISHSQTCLVKQEKDSLLSVTEPKGDIAGSNSPRKPEICRQDFQKEIIVANSFSYSTVEKGVV